MRTGFNLFFTFFILIISCNSINIEELKERGDSEFNNGKFENSIRIYNDVLLQDPTSFDAFYFRGLAKYNNGDLKGAIEDFESAISLREVGIYYYHLARMLQYSGDTLNAITTYESAIEKDSMLFEALNNKALLFQNIGKYKKALEGFNKVLLIASKSSIGYNNRGMLYQELGNHTKAIEDFDKGMKFQSNFSYLYYNKAISLAALNKIDQAFVNLELAIKYDPNNSLAWNDRGILFKYKGEIERACSDWKKAVQLGNSDAKYYINKFCL